MAAVASPFRTPDFISPNARRRRAIILTSTNTPTNHLAENDDAAERRQRRLSKATSATLQSPATPRSASRLDSERYKFYNLFFIAILCYWDLTKSFNSPVNLYKLMLFL